MQIYIENRIKASQLGYLLWTDLKLDKERKREICGIEREQRGSRTRRREAKGRNAGRRSAESKDSESLLYLFYSDHKRNTEKVA